MSSLERLEHRLRQLLEGAFARAAGGGVQPLEIARALGHELDRTRLVGVSGAFVPNQFRIALHPADWQRLEPFSAVIRAELEDFVRGRAEEAGDRLAGAILVELAGADDVPAGQVVIESSAGEVPAAELLSPESSADPDSGASLRILSGPRRGQAFPLPPEGAVLGRDTSCSVCLSEPSASRRHAEIVVQGTTLLLRDLDSTNGTLVNGRPITEHHLVPGDTIAIGSTVLELQVVHTV